MRGYKVRGLNPSALDTALIDEPNYEPYSYTVRGSQPHQYEEIKRDIFLTSRYDKNLSPYEVQEYNRAQNQGWLNKVGSGLISRGSSIVPKIGQGIGHVGGFVYEAGSLYYVGFRGNHIHLPSDFRILNSPYYVEFFWICI